MNRHQVATSEANSSVMIRTCGVDSPGFHLDSGSQYSNASNQVTTGPWINRYRPTIAAEMPRRISNSCLLAGGCLPGGGGAGPRVGDPKSTRLNSSHIS